MAEVKSQVSQINQLCASTSEIQHQLTELLSRPTSTVALPSDLAESFGKISDIPTDKIHKIETSVNELTEKVTVLHDTVTSNNAGNTINGVPMQPNTSSPHLNVGRNLTSDCEPFVSYEAAALTPDLASSLKTLVQGQATEFKAVGSDLSRDVLYFGEYAYRYTGGTHEAKPLPVEVERLIEHIRPKLPNPDMTFNSCLITRYNSGANYIPSHRDDEPVIDPDSHIVTISIGSERTMVFKNNSGSINIDQKLADGSMLVCSRFAQDFWLHSIDKEESSDPGIRFSFTLRNVSPHYLNSTIILGDSNTQHLNFGSGKGKLGAWMPGKRVKAGHIGALPDATQIGPYRNIIIHTGVNNLNSTINRQSSKALIDMFEDKILGYTTVYPKSKVFVSLLLPSRSSALNRRISEFNNLLLDMTCKLNRVSIIENTMFGDVLTNEHGRWRSCGPESNDFEPNLNDLLHLGKHGIRLLAKNFKNVVVRKKKPQSRERFDGGRGGYARAVERGRGQNGGSQPS